MNLPSTLTLYRRIGVDTLYTANALTFLTEEDGSPAPGFERLDNPNEPGGDVCVALFDSERDAQLFRDGFQLSSPDDDITDVFEEARGSDGTVVFGLIYLFGDSDDNHLQVKDHRQSGK